MAKKNAQTEETIHTSNLKSQIATSRLEPTRSIEHLIYTIRNTQVILDEDIAKLYNVTTGHLNEKVKRNINRFDYDFMFQLTSEEFAILKSQIAISSWGGRRNLPFAFTELGVAMPIMDIKELNARYDVVQYFAENQEILAATQQDLGKKWFAVALMSETEPETLLSKL